MLRFTTGGSSSLVMENSFCEYKPSSVQQIEPLWVRSDEKEEC